MNINSNHKMQPAAQTSRLKLFSLMKKHPDQDWRSMIKTLLVTPLEERTHIIKEALIEMPNEEERVMAILDLQLFFGRDMFEY